MVEGYVVRVGEDFGCVALLGGGWGVCNKVGVGGGEIEAYMHRGDPYVRKGRGVRDGEREGTDGRYGWRDN